MLRFDEANERSAQRNLIRFLLGGVGGDVPVLGRLGIEFKLDALGLVIDRTGRVGAVDAPLARRLDGPDPAGRLPRAVADGVGIVPGLDLGYVDVEAVGVIPGLRLHLGEPRRDRGLLLDGRRIGQERRRIRIEEVSTRPTGVNVRKVPVPIPAREIRGSGHAGHIHQGAGVAPRLEEVEVVGVGAQRRDLGGDAGEVGIVHLGVIHRRLQLDLVVERADHDAVIPGRTLGVGEGSAIKSITVLHPHVLAVVVDEGDVRAPRQLLAQHLGGVQHQAPAHAIAGRGSLIAVIEAVVHVGRARDGADHRVAGGLLLFVMAPTEGADERVVPQVGLPRERLRRGHLADLGAGGVEAVEVTIVRIQDLECAGSPAHVVGGILRLGRSG